MSGRVQVLSCGCICRTHDGKLVVVNKRCSYHRVHPDHAPASAPAEKETRDGR